MAKETKVTQAQKDEEIEELAEMPEEELVTEEALKEQTPAVEEAAEEKEEAVTKKKKKHEEEIVEERFYTIPLQKALVRPPKKRAPRAMQLIKVFVTMSMLISFTNNSIVNLINYFFNQVFKQIIRLMLVLNQGISLPISSEANTFL